MAITIKLRYENGHFIPLSDIPGIQDGDEVEIEWAAQPSEELSERRLKIREALEQTVGLWGDIEGVEELFEQQRQQWNAAWQQKLNSL